MKKTESYIIFTVAGQLFSLSVEYVKGILEVPKIFNVPQAPEYIMGVVNVDGEVIPLIDAAIKLKMGNIAFNDYPTIIVLERVHNGAPQRLCLRIDEVLEVLEFDNMTLQPLPISKFEFDERLVDGMFKTENDFAMMINVNNFFRNNLDEVNLLVSNDQLN
jgi:purine-binding chemotaxis protein CheW